MATKKKAKTSVPANLATTIKDSGQEIWLAGLGAFSKTQAEGGRVFAALVSEGKALQHKLVDAAGNVAGRISDVRVSVLPERATEVLIKLGQMFEDRTADALGRCGVATKQDIDALSRRVAKLATEMEKVKGLNVKPVAKGPMAQG